MAKRKTIADRIRERAKERRFIEVTEWGEKIRIYRLTPKQRSQMMIELASSENGDSLEIGIATAAKMFAMGAYTPDGKEKLFDDDEELDIDFDRYIEQLLELNGFDRLDTAKKNSRRTRRGS